MKVLSVIVPAYDMERWLDACLASVAPVPYVAMPPYEVVVVNDGSTDGTYACAQAWQKRHPDVFRTIDKTNGHYGSCINAALEISEGFYVKILDADDMFDAAAFRSYLGLLASAAADMAPPDVIVNDVEWIDASGRCVRDVRYGLPPAFGMEDILLRAGNLSMHALAYRTALVREMGYRQTEGICYTDTEWLTLPMSVVTSGMAFAHRLYRYRFGRAGQSVETASYVRNMGHLETVFRSLAAFGAQGRRFASPLNRDYVSRQVMRQALLVSCIYFFNVPVGVALHGLAAFLDMVAECSPDALAAIEDSRVFTWSPWPLRHLRLWRRHPKARRLIMGALRIYERIIR